MRRLGWRVPAPASVEKVGETIVCPTPHSTLLPVLLLSLHFSYNSSFSPSTTTSLLALLLQLFPSTSSSFLPLLLLSLHFSCLPTTTPSFLLYFTISPSSYFLSFLPHNSHPLPALPLLFLSKQYPFSLDTLHSPFRLSWTIWLFHFLCPTCLLSPFP